MLVFSEVYNISIHFHLRTEGCLEKLTDEAHSLILASAQLDHLSCLYGKLVSSCICLEVLFKLCVALTAGSFPCSHQIFSSLGLFPPCFGPVLILGVSLFLAAQFFTGTLSSSNKMSSRFSSNFCPIPIKCILPFHNSMLSL